MQPPFQSKQEVIINASLEAVWSFSMDLTKIPEFHPRVVKVDSSAKQALHIDVIFRAGNTPAQRRTSRLSRCRKLSLCCRRTHLV